MMPCRNVCGDKSSSDVPGIDRLPVGESTGTGGGWGCGVSTTGSGCSDSGGVDSTAATGMTSASSCCETGCSNSVANGKSSMKGGSASSLSCIAFSSVCVSIFCCCCLSIFRCCAFRRRELLTSDIRITISSGASIWMILSIIFSFVGYQFSDVVFS